jgi:predicted secreted protein
MSSKAVSGIGAKFKRSDMASNPQFTAIAEVADINGPNKSRDTTDVTSLDSEGGYKEFIGGLRDGGEVQLDMNFTADGYDVLNDDFESDDPRDYQIVLPDTDGTTLDFSALCTRLDLKTPKGDKISASATFKISGPVSLS